MDKKILRLEDYSKIKEVYEEIKKIINKAELSSLNVLGLLEALKLEFFIEEDD